MRGDGLYLRKNVWQIRFRGPQHGKSKRGDYRLSTGIKTSGTDEDRKKTRKAAERMLAEKRREWANLKHGIPGFVAPSAEKKTIDDLLAAVISEAERRPLKGLRELKVHTQHVRRLLGFRRAVSVTRKDLNEYIAKRRAEGAADRTIDIELEPIKSGYRLLGLESRAPDTRNLRLVRGNANARTGFWERAQFERFVAELPSELLRDVWRFGYFTGMRRGEILALTWDGFDRETRTLRLHGKASKTGRARVIPIGGWPELSEVVERRLAARRLDCPLIFHSHGHRVGDFYTTMRRALDRAGLQGLTFHDLRRSAARNMLLAGVPQAVAMKITGHETDSMFRRYAIVDEAAISAALGLRAAYEATLPITTVEPKVAEFPKAREKRASER